MAIVLASKDFIFLKVQKNDNFVKKGYATIGSKHRGKPV